MRRGLVCLLVMLTSVSAWAGEWSRTFKVGTEPAVNLKVDDARVRVYSWDRNDVEARVTYTGYKEDQVRIRDYSNETGVRLDITTRTVVCFGICHYSMQVELHVPKKLKLDVTSGDGSIEASDVAGLIRLTSGDGHITADRIDGELDARTSDGRMRISGRFDALELSSGDGSIEVVVQSGSKMLNDYTIRTGDGRINVEWPDGLGANLDAHTGDGHLDVNIPVTATFSRRDNNTVRGAMFGGGRVLRMRSGDGSITLRKL